MAAVKNKKTGKVPSFPERLQEGVSQWDRLTKPMRKARLRMLQHYAAGWYDGNETISQPINFIDRGVQILGPFLISNNPRVMINSRRGLEPLRPFARTFELALEHLFDEMKLSRLTLRPAVINALFGMGVTKCGITHAEEVEIAGVWHDVGQPYCDNVDFDDYIGDPSARTREEMEFEGNRYRVDAEYVLDSGLFKNTEHLTTQEYPQWGQTHPNKISQGQAPSVTGSIKKTVELIDLWIPKENIIVTIPRRGEGKKILRIVEWDGPEGGSYDTLGFRYFPESPLPIPPVFTWLDINNTMNRLIAKVRSQAERAKNVVMYDLGAADDMETVQESPDGGTAGVRSVDSIKEVTFGMINEQLFPFIQYLEQQYSITGGNLYTIGGRESQAETLGQEQILQANASKQLEDMVDNVHAFTQSITRKLAWFVWTDPLIQMPIIKRIADVDVEVEFSAAAREGDFFDYQFTVEPYSMSRMSPEMRYQRLLQLVSQVVLPTAQIAAAQGNMLNTGPLVEEFARYLDVRNIQDWWSTTVPQQTHMNPYQPQQGQAEPKPQSQTQTVSGSDKMKTSENLNNLLQQQARTGGGAGQTTGGMQ